MKRRVVIVLSMPMMVVFLAVVGVVFTELGPWLLLRVAAPLAAPWQVTARTSGSLWSGIALRDVQVHNDSMGIDLRATKLDISLYPWTVVLSQPQLEIAVVEDSTGAVAAAAVDIELPLKWLPAVDIRDGRIDYRLGDRAHLRAAEWRARYRGIEQGRGALFVAMQISHTVADSQSASAHLQLNAELYPQQVVVDSLVVRGVFGLSQIELDAAGQLGLDALRPLSVQLSTKANEDFDSLAMAMDIKGALEPLDLRASLNGALRREAQGPIDFAAKVRAESEAVFLDSFAAQLFAGVVHARAAYDMERDSLSIAASADRLLLAAIDSSMGGRVSGALEAAVDLKQMSYRGVLDVEAAEILLADIRPFAAKLHIDHRADGATRGQLYSDFIDVEASGHSDMTGQYDLALTGQVRPQEVLAIDWLPLSLRGAIAPDSLRLQLHAEHLPGELGAGFGPLQADFFLRQMRYLNAEFLLEEGLLWAGGSFDLQEMAADSIEVVVRALDLRRALPGVGGELAVEMRAAGPLHADSLKASAQFNVRDLTYEDWRAGHWAAVADWQNGESAISVEGDRAVAKIATNKRGELEAQVEFSGLLLQRALSDSLALMGVLDFLAPLDRLDGATASLSLDAMALSAGELSLASAAPLQMAYSPQGLVFEQVKLQTPLGAMTVVGAASPDSLDLQLDLPQMQLARVLPHFEFGTGTAQIVVGGSIARPEVIGRSRLSALALDTLAIGDLSLDFALGDSLQVDVELERQGHREATLTLAAPASALLGGSSAGAARLGLVLDPLSLQAPLSYALNQPVRGELALRADLVLPIDHIDSSFSWGAIEGDLSLKKFVIDTQVDGDSLHIELAPGARARSAGGEVVFDSLRIDMSRYDRDAGFLVPAGALNFAGRLPAEGEADLRLRLSDVDLVFFGGPDGTADVHAELAGTQARPRLAILLEVDSDDLGILTGRAAGDSAGVDWHLNWTTLVEDSLVVDGGLPWDLQAGRIAWDAGWLKAQSTNMGLLVFSDMIVSLDHLDGHLAMDIEARGLDSTMVLGGRVDFSDMEFALVDITPVYALPSGSLEFSGRRGDLRDFVAESERSYDEFALAGSLDFSSLAEPYFDVQLRFVGLDFRYEDIFRADDISASLRMAGTPTASKLSGSMNLREPLAEPVLVVLNAPPVPPPPPALRDEFLENMELDVHVDIRNLAIDSELAKANASGGIGISGTFYKPVFQGDIIVEEGRVFVLSRQFDLEQSRIVLNSLVPTRSLLDVAYDPLELDPDLDLRATTKVVDRDDGEEYMVTMTLQGPAKSAAPSFQSTPSLGFNNIVRLLAFGTRSSLNDNYSFALGAAAGQFLGKRVEKVGLDEFAVLPSSTIIGADQTKPALRMGKYLEVPFPMWVRYEAAVNRMGQGEVRLEHRLNSILTLTGAAQSEYDRYGLGVGLKKEF